MRKIVLTFGLISGAILAALMIVAMLFQDQIGFDRGAIVGYTSMVLAFLMVYFGVRSYRDTVRDGRIRFGRAFVRPTEAEPAEGLHTVRESEQAGEVGGPEQRDPADAEA